MDKYDYLIDSLYEFEMMESLSSNQEIPGQLGNNINGVTNLDLTGEEELITSGLYDDAWDESSSSGFEDLPLTDDDIQLECIFESCLNELDSNKAKQLNKTNKAWGAAKKANNTRMHNLKNANKTGKAKQKSDAKLKRKNGRIDAKVNRANSHNSNASSDKKFGTKYKNARAIDKKYHADMAKNTTGIRKGYHKIKSLGNKKLHENYDLVLDTLCEAENKKSPSLLKRTKNNIS